MEIVLGTYEELLLGYRIVAVGENFQLEQSFTAHTHTGCIKTVAVSRKGILASGGTDETIKLFNLKKRTEMGSLMQHTGTVTHVEFYRGSHLFSCAEDGTFCVYKGFTWECLKTLKDKSAIDCISVHPSGKMALSVSRDRSLHTWNLVTGKSAYITKLKQAADIVQWSTDGDHYVVAMKTQLDIYKVETAAVDCSVMTEKRINCVSFLNNTTVIYGGEGGDVFVHDFQKNKELMRLDTDTVRIRGLAVTTSPDGETPWVVLASSAGDIIVYSVYLDLDSEQCSFTKLIEENCDFRVTCLSIVPLCVTEEWTEDRKGGTTALTKQEKSEKLKSKKRKDSSEGGDKLEVLQEDRDSGIDDSKHTTVKTEKLRKKKRKEANPPAEQEINSDQSESDNSEKEKDEEKQKLLANEAVKIHTIKKEEMTPVPTAVSKTKRKRLKTSQSKKTKLK